MNSLYKKTDPFTGEEFVTTNSLKKFINRKSQIAYNNHKKKILLEEISFVNKHLLKNRKILNDVLKNKEKITISVNQLINYGFLFSVITHFKTINNKTVFCIYEFSYSFIEDKQIKIEKNGRNYFTRFQSNS